MDAEGRSPDHVPGAPCSTEERIDRLERRLDHIEELLAQLHVGQGAVGGMTTPTA